MVNRSPPKAGVTSSNLVGRANTKTGPLVGPVLVLVGLPP